MESDMNNVEGTVESTSKGGVYKIVLRDVTETHKECEKQMFSEFNYVTKPLLLAYNSAEPVDIKKICNSIIKLQEISYQNKFMPPAFKDVLMDVRLPGRLHMLESNPSPYEIRMANRRMFVNGILNIFRPIFGLSRLYPHLLGNKVIFMGDMDNGSSIKDIRELTKRYKTLGFFERLKIRLFGVSKLGPSETLKLDYIAKEQVYSGEVDPSVHGGGSICADLGVTKEREGEFIKEMAGKADDKTTSYLVETKTKTDTVTEIAERAFDDTCLGILGVNNKIPAKTDSKVKVKLHNNTVYDTRRCLCSFYELNADSSLIPDDAIGVIFGVVESIKKDHTIAYVVELRDKLIEAGVKPLYVIELFRNTPNERLLIGTGIKLI